MFKILLQSCLQNFTKHPLHPFAECCNPGKQNCLQSSQLLLNPPLQTFACALSSSVCRNTVQPPAPMSTPSGNIPCLCQQVLIFYLISSCPIFCLVSFKFFSWNHNKKYILHWHTFPLHLHTHTSPTQKVHEIICKSF